MILVVIAALFLLAKSKTSPTNLGAEHGISHVFGNEQFQRPENGTILELHPQEETENFLRTVDPLVTGSTPNTYTIARSNFRTGGIARVAGGGGNF